MTLAWHPTSFVSSYPLLAQSNIELRGKQSRFSSFQFGKIVSVLRLHLHIPHIQSMDTEARTEVARLWRVYKTIHQLVSDRVRRLIRSAIGHFGSILCGHSFTNPSFFATRVTWFLNQNWRWIWILSETHLREHQTLSTFSMAMT
jgi:hypothetical protein